ncbi:hypothetical protein BDW60DRAFT_220676 [Aspergillus nidulans var. acristatus]
MESSITLAMTGITIASQILTAATDTFCGPSGQDSVVRASLAPLDATSGLLIFLALHYFGFIRDGFVLNPPLWSLLHATADVQRTPGVEFAIRTDWRQIEKPTRIANLRWTGASTQVSNTLACLAINCLFIRARVPPQQPVANLPRTQVAMSRLGVENAAAQSFSRFLTVVTWSTILYIAHNAVLWFYVGRWWIYIPLAFAGFGSLLITMFQTSSIFAFSELVWTHLRFNYPTKAFYYFLEHLWPPVISRLVPSHTPGTSMYSMFQSPGADEFAHAQGRLETRIAERTSSTVRDLYEPVIAGVINADPVPKALHLLEQVVVAVFIYYDFSDQSINTKTGNEITMALVPAPAVKQQPQP